jgi:RNA polymerase sigma-70 factor (ECF subfamily)
MNLPLRRSSGVEQTLTMAIDQQPAPAAASFEALYRASAEAVFAYAASLLRDRSAAEEVTAAAFERAFRKRRSFDPRRGTQRAWLFGIARNAALDELRRRKRRAGLESDPEDVGALAPEDHAELALRREAVRAALAALDGQERDLIALKFAGGLSNAEIARVLGMSESNAGTRLHRTITKLRKACHE